MNATLNWQLPLIGIVGGIGSGKSSVARHLAERFPIRVLDADQAGHEALLEDDIKVRIREQFGDEVFNDSGEIDRRNVARRVFGDSPECREERGRLEQIVHPRIRELLVNGIEAIQATELTVQAIILDAPILFESGWDEICDAVIFVDVPRVIRQQRLQNGRGWSEDELARRESSQLPLQEKQNRSDWTIDNTGRLDDTTQQFAEFWNAHFATPLRSALRDEFVFEETQPHAD